MAKFNFEDMKKAGDKKDAPMCKTDKKPSGRKSKRFGGRSGGR